ncbi:MAG: YebC/PmpR family DNA-binding transcriptional regulator [Anaerolineae bacterium]|jgi:YebC/PmpR family DNA-binding regulatory protein|uniref:YebC/PmpR family DNA-binding transcriptional regulator n=1 Tax=Candidatus Flexifilum breve TaxID=3140694 RepID=UPI001ACC9C99|nr:YebC/PmpR family DNA-binding transcriptional regulator [Chloroflexota bacterium]MBN8635765.1 YebC/PmpR family DNA-binding transcriptional regulator [Anaerolineae bacterium]
MSGHSKWSTIKRKKGVADAQRGKIFTRIARDIAQAAREGGSDENSNAKLKLAIQKAKASNMPKENIERAILRGTGKLDGADMEEVTYEGYGVEGVAFLIDTLSDNKNRTLAEIKRVFNKAGGALASAGSVAWQFEQKGSIELAGDNLDFDTVFMTAAEAGAEDVVDDEGAITVVTPREALALVEEALTAAGYVVENSELKWIAKNETEVSPDKAVANMRIMSNLEELDDVQAVASNLMITDAALEAFETA